MARKNPQPEPCDSQAPAHGQMRRRRYLRLAQAEQNKNELCGWIGVGVTPMTRAVALSLGMAEPYGAILAEPQPGSPAAAAPYVNFRRLRTRRRISKLAHACCLVGRELAFDFLRAILCSRSSLVIGTSRNTVADKVYVAMEIRSSRRMRTLVTQTARSRPVR